MSTGRATWVVVALTVIGACSVGTKPAKPAATLEARASGRTSDQRLLDAIENDDIDAVRAALDAGANPNGPAGGERVLGFAILNDNVGVVGELLRAGADPNGITMDVNAVPMLVLAVSMDRRKMVGQLLRAGARPADPGPHQGLTPLAAAAFYGASTVCEPLVRAGADVNGWSNWPASSSAPSASFRGGRRTPLMIAASRGHLKAVVSLLSLGADSKLRTDRDQSVIELLSEYQNPILQIRKHLEHPRFLDPSRGPNGLEPRK